MTDKIVCVFSSFKLCLQEVSKLGPDVENFTPSDVERALWSTAATSMPKKTSKTPTSGKGKAAGGAASAAAKGVKRKRGI